MVHGWLNRWSGCGLAVVAAVLSRSAGAQPGTGADRPGFDPWAPTERDLADPAVDGGDAAAGWRPEAFASFAWGDEGEVFAVHAGAERWLDDIGGWAVAPQLTLGIAQNTDDDRPLLTGFDLQFRRYLGSAGLGGGSDGSEPEASPGGWRWFLEAGAGAQYVGPESLPRRGTHANFRLRGGVGARYDLNDQLGLIAGINWLHMSNANLLPGNNGHDGPMVYLGLTGWF